MLMLEEQQAEVNIPISQSGLSVTIDNERASAAIKPTKSKFIEIEIGIGIEI